MAHKQTRIISILKQDLLDAGKDCCACCPAREKCLTEKQTFKTIYRHIWLDFKDEAHTFTLSEWGKKIYARRKETTERSFADAKELHGQ